jgi:vacuolar-type H+-ATPase subunit H
MILKYAGPKAIISHRGITFDNNKEDKYVFLNIAAQLIVALDHEYFDDKSYSYPTDNKPLADSEILSLIKKHNPNLDETIESWIEHTNKDMDHLLERADENVNLNEEERDVLKKNIKMMRNYHIQRSINKSIYYSAIETLAKIMQRDHLDHVITPMFQKYAHVLHSMQGAMKKLKNPIDSKIEIYEGKDGLVVKLQVIKLGEGIALK